MMEGRVIEYRPGCGLDYHNSPLIGEIPNGDYTHFHRSIDQLRSLNERGVLGTCTTINGATTTTISTNGLIDYNHHPHHYQHQQIHAKYHKDNHLNVIVGVGATNGVIEENPNTTSQLIDDQINNNHLSNNARSANERPVTEIEMKHFVVEKTEQSSSPTSPSSTIHQQHHHQNHQNNHSTSPLDDVKETKVRG